MEKILIVNGGSSSLKFMILNKENNEYLASGLAERIFIDGNFIIKINGVKYETQITLNNHKDAVQVLKKKLIEHNIISDITEIVGIGHRVVQGGKEFPESVIIDKDVLQKIRDLGALAPLHNPGEADVIEAFMNEMPDVINIAAFDTSFHTTMPKKAYMYAVPKEWYTKYNVRRYGAHGISHKYISQRMEKELKKPVTIINCHLGNGASICAIKNGKSINTSMGLTPLAGLIMGTRSGDLDPSIIEYMHKKTNKSIIEITDELNNKSGILGLSGISSDFRYTNEEAKKGNEDALNTIEMFVNRIATYIVDYANQLGGKNIDGIIFTAGIGENNAKLREQIIEKLPLLKLEISKNNEKTFYDLLKISSDNSEIPIYAVRTNEELLIAEDLIRLMK